MSDHEHAHDHAHGHGHRHDGDHDHGDGEGHGHGHRHRHGEGREDGRRRGRGRRHDEDSEGAGERRPRRRRRRERSRDEDGRFATTVVLEDVLEAFGAVAGPVVTTTDVSDVLGVSTEAAREKLNRLVERGDLRRRKTGRTVVYWRREDDGDH